MPFTFSHPAVVLPLAAKRCRLSATGLIVGSMTPDFEYFLRMRDASRYSHTLLGVFWFDLPMALLLCFLYHQSVRDSLFDNLPVFFKERVFIYKNFQWSKYFSKNWIVVIVSILIGVFTHLVWDFFTHETNSFVRQTDFSEMLKVGGINLAGYRFLQYTSTAVGGLIVIFTILSLKKRKYPDKPVDYNYWAIVVFIILSIMIMRRMTGLKLHDFRSVVVSFISGGMLALILTPIILNKQSFTTEPVLPAEKEV